jgi:hypothetical protein
MAETALPQWFRRILTRLSRRLADLRLKVSGAREKLFVDKR